MLKVRNVLECSQDRVIGMSAKDGHILFDTYRNTKERVELYSDFVVVSLWGDVRAKDTGGFAHSVCPYLAMYIRPKEVYDDE